MCNICYIFDFNNLEPNIMTNNSLKRLAELAGRFEKLADDGLGSNVPPGKYTPSDNADLVQRSEKLKFPGGNAGLGGQETLPTKDNFGNTKDLSMPSGIMSALRYSVKEVRDSLVGLKTNEQDKSKLNLALFDLSNNVKKVSEIYMSVNSKAKSEINSLLTDVARALVSRVRLEQFNDISPMLKGLLYKAANGQLNDAYWAVAIKSPTFTNTPFKTEDAYNTTPMSSTTASLRSIHKFLEKKASEDYELSAREIAKLKALVKSI